MEFVENPGKEKWTTYRGIAKTGDDIEKKALDLIKIRCSRRTASE